MKAAQLGYVQRVPATYVGIARISYDRKSARRRDCDAHRARVQRGARRDRDDRWHAPRGEPRAECPRTGHVHRDGPLAKRVRDADIVAMDQGEADRAAAPDVRDVAGMVVLRALAVTTRVDKDITPACHLRGDRIGLDSAPPELRHPTEHAKRAHGARGARPG